MVNPVRLTSKLLVSPQLQIEDLAALNVLGIRTIVCNRPDGEAPGQPTAQALSQAARQLDMTFVYLPVTPKMQIRDGDPQQLSDALDSAGGEVLAYCRTGKRSAAMWALSQRGKLPANEIVRTAAQSGFDISNLGDQLTLDVAPAGQPEMATPTRKRGFWSRIFGAR